jgi:hypothetical protein
VLPLAADTDQAVYGVAATSNQVFLVGNFSTVAGQKRAYVASVDAHLNALTPWNPGSDFSANTVSVSDDTLFVGGLFMRLGGSTSRSLGAYRLSLSGVPTIVSNSLRRLSDSSIQLRVSAPGAAQATVMVSSNLTSWQPLQAVSLIGGSGIFTDTGAASYSRRFYRLRVP